jgi:ribosomal protection tetracycline resistance protein
LRVPTLFFVNKIDRVGADEMRTVDAIRQRLTDQLAVMAGPHEPIVEVLAANDDDLLRAYLDGEAVSDRRLERTLAEQTAARHVHPVYFGSALTGVGIDEVMHGIATHLPASDGDTDGAPAGTVFKIERAPNGEKVALVRMFAGTLHARDRIELGHDGDTGHTVTGLEVYADGGVDARSSTRAGEIARVRGLASARIGDTFGAVPRARAVGLAFSPPTLETAVVPSDPRDKPTLFRALDQLAEQDPLIDLRQDDSRQELFLSLYGEVQREVVAQTLATEYGVEIEYRPVTPLCIERPLGSGAALETIPRHRSPRRPFLATVGLAVEPGDVDSGVTFELAVPVTSIPMHVFGTVDAFRDVMDRTVRDTLGQGLCGWAVTDVVVTMTDCDYQAPPRKWPGTTLSDYRLLTPLVLMTALRRAGTAVCEPTLDVHLEFPADVLGPVLSTLGALEAKPGPPTIDGATGSFDAELPSARLHDLQSRFPDLTRGEGVVESSFAGYRPVRGAPPSRPRTDRNPLDRADYLRRLSGLTLE